MYIIYTCIFNILLMSQSSTCRSFQMLSEVTSQQILEPIVEVMKSLSAFFNFSVNLVSNLTNYVVTENFSLMLIQQICFQSLNSLN